MIAVIPSFNPDEHLKKVLEDLHELPECKVIVVDDGSNKECKKIFDVVSGCDVLLTHEVNRGKGAAIKTALTYMNENVVEDTGVVFVDCDGQHKIKDIRRVMECFQSNPDAMVLGSREFIGDIPWKSSFGNKTTRTFFRLLTGVKLRDTQTGLRVFSTKYIPMLLKVNGNRYEYEMNTLMTWAKKKLPIKEVSIETVYENNKNETTHFRPIRDSLRIYGVLLRFLFSSCFCAIVDYGLFFLLTALFVEPTDGAGVAVCNVVVRLVTAILNYCINRELVFRSGESKWKSSIKYAALAAGILLFNTTVIYFLTEYLHIPVALTKILVESISFFISFIVQQRVVF